MAKTRHVFGRVRVKIDNKEYWFEQRKDGVYFRPFHARRWAQISFPSLVDFHVGQFRLGGGILSKEL
ncbi:MAG: hypothetical protein KGL39_48520 [Patescibacteria group bacterium]|nr:hypothetical protein [Patescibacteria group bacterium]